MFARERAADIETHWAEALARQPQLYNGRVFLSCGWGVEEAGAQTVLRSQHFETDFKNFLAWRDFGFPDMSIANSFAAAALLCSDGAYVLGEMSVDTANAGRIYFPAGTPDPNDKRGDWLDFEGSVQRELTEETGLLPETLVMRSGWTIVLDGPLHAIVKEFRAHEDAVGLIRRIERGLALQRRPEFARVHVVRRRSDLIPGRMPQYILTYLADRLAD